MMLIMQIFLLMIYAYRAYYLLSSFHKFYNPAGSKARHSKLHKSDCIIKRADPACCLDLNIITDIIAHERHIFEGRAARRKSG